MMSMMQQQWKSKYLPDALYGIGGIGEKEGIVGYLTDNRLTRETLILESLRNAMSSRFSKLNYD